MLGIDAAWTAHNASGVALVAEQGRGWRLVAAHASYAGFTGGGGMEADVPALLATAQRLCGARVDVIAVDMPLSLKPIAGRRASDIGVSSAYGARKCATHSPSAERPGLISDRLRAGFAAAGYGLMTLGSKEPGLAEVYPHPALVELTGASERLPYKASRARLYWPGLTPLERRKQLIKEWQRIAEALEGQIAGVKSLLPKVTADSKGKALKAFEDTLDAVICCWIGICILEGKATAFGDHESAIWVPRRDAVKR